MFWGTLPRSPQVMEVQWGLCHLGCFSATCRQECGWGVGPWLFAAQRRSGSRRTGWLDILTPGWGRGGARERVSEFVIQHWRVLLWGKANTPAAIHLGRVWLAGACARPPGKLFTLARGKCQVPAHYCSSDELRSSSWWHAIPSSRHLPNPQTIETRAATAHHRNTLMSAWCYLEGVVGHRTDHIFKEDLRGESVSVVDYGLSVGTVPAVHLHTPTATTQSPDGERVSWLLLFLHRFIQGPRKVNHTEYKFTVLLISAPDLSCISTCD